MKNSIIKLTLRDTRSFLGRYLAILLIVTLGVGLYSGLKVTKPAMAATCEDYLAQQNFYDFHLISSVGFSEEDADEFKKITGVADSEGGYSLDALIEVKNIIAPYKMLALPEEVNLPLLTAGRYPQSNSECLADDEDFTEADIGTTVTLSGDNTSDVYSGLTESEFTIVGIVNSPLYLGVDRGTTNLAAGTLSGYLYLQKSCFAGEALTDIYVTLEKSAPIYSDEYDDLVEAAKSEITTLGESIVQNRYEDILTDGQIPADMALELGIPDPECYVLTRAENAGYQSFENDTSIISGIANIFPLFFVLIAMMVCINTMSRMVDEERTQIGVLKATGFSNGAITAKYLLYAGSATILGWILGFFLGTWGLPLIFWSAYSSLYDFTPISYLLDPALAAITLAVAVIGILGSTWFSCRRELVSVPATLIRPRPPKNGKRVWLEKITFIWKRLSFLHKVTFRNLFRYKKRLIMMLLGISCCAALVVTAFGIRDSMIDIGSLQFDEVQQYDIEISFTAGKENEIISAVENLSTECKALPASLSRVDLSGESGDTMKSVKQIRFSTDDTSGFWNFHSGGEALDMPKDGEALISRKTADKLNAEMGDIIEISDSDHRVITVRVSGIFDNYADNYVILSADTGSDEIGLWQSDTIFLNTEGDVSAISEELMTVSDVTGISRTETTKSAIEDALSCLDYIILFILLFSAALAFIVVYNLTNINLAERSREIATVQVLGFYPRETESYVLRENLVLSVLASAVGLPLGKVFHYIVMRQILIDNFYFPIQITSASYILAFVCTVIFAVIVNIFMKRRVNGINMAEALKAVE